VVPTETTAQVGRYSMVIFVDFKTSHIWDKVTYPRVQDFEPGFNYQLTHEEFSKFFIPYTGVPQTA
jgi:hypothetical protein